MGAKTLIEYGACSGGSMAILGAEGREDAETPSPGFLDDHGVRLLWQPSLSRRSRNRRPP
jgi:hypothetical protein